MRKTTLILILVSSVVLSGCAGMKGKAEVARIEEWASETAPKAQAGEIKWSSFYEQYYNNVRSAEGLIYNQAAFLGVLDMMITASLDFEAGKITEQEFRAKGREGDILMTQSYEEVQARLAEMQAESLQRASQNLMQMQQQQQYQSPVQTNCLKTGNMVNCTSY